MKTWFSSAIILFEAAFRVSWAMIVPFVPCLSFLCDQTTIWFQQSLLKASQGESAYQTENPGPIGHQIFSLSWKISYTLARVLKIPATWTFTCSLRDLTLSSKILGEWRRFSQFLQILYFLIRQLDPVTYIGKFLCILDISHVHWNLEQQNTEIHGNLSYWEF